MKTKFSLPTQLSYLGGGEVHLHLLLTSPLYRGVQVISGPGTFILPDKNLSTQWTGGLVGSRAGLNIQEKTDIFCPCQESNPILSSPQTSDYTSYITPAVMPC